MQELHPDDLSPMLTDEEKAILCKVDKDPALACAAHQNFVQNNSVYAIREMQRLLLIPPPACEDEGKVLTNEREGPGFEF